jgi:DNA primase
MSSVRDILQAAAPELAARARPGHNYLLVPCPFHGGGQERTPSCSISTEKPVFHCHACGESGHLSRLLRNFGLDGGTAARMIESAGLGHGTAAPKGRAAIIQSYKTGKDPYRGRFVLDEDLLDAYRMAPKPLIEAGFDKDVLRHFEVGVDLSQARITFPIRNLYGELVGISGRTLLDAEPRYKIYREELVQRGKREMWHIPTDYSIEEVKKATFWHAHIVYPFLIDAEETLVITEGFKACMWVYQHGFPSVVALIGARMSHQHANLVARTCKHVVLFLDNNEAGHVGTFHAAEVLERIGVRPWIANYPDDRQQPDDLSPDEVEQAIVTAHSFIKWRRA